MNSIQNKQLLTLQSYLTTPYDCGYLPDQIACSQVVVPAHLVDTLVYSKLITLGFRRSGLFVYRPSCASCQGCISVRVPVDAFVPSRNQKRACKQLAHLEAQVYELRDTDEYFALYQKYQKTRHQGSGMDEDSRQQYQEFLSNSRVTTQIVEYREPSISPRCA